MLLEMDNSELLHMLDTPESLKSKVEEAVTVLKEHQRKELVAAAAVGGAVPTQPAIAIPSETA